MIGKTVAHYEIVETLGAGGMGEVYRAKDLELGREVAIKVLRKELASDPDGLKRFEREARTASALNHPNITTIHHIGEHEGTRYIAMELVEGRTLRELMSEARLSRKTTLDFAKQIAGGLAKAHAAGIVHRDLKPENVMVTEDGLVKILDFGLAKLIPQGADVDHEKATVTKATQYGLLLGTVPYMSPEQAAGRAVDYRSDQFSFGSMLYEMLTGRRAFNKESIPQTLADIIEREPEPIDDAPDQVLAIVERCLAKEPDERYEETKELARELASVPDTASMSRRTRRRVLWLAAAVVAASLVFGLRDWISSNLTSSSIDSIAVLPLQNLSGDPEQEYLVDGMTEALITDLAKIGALKVVSRSSIMRYKGTDKPLVEIAAELDVDVIVEGSALRIGDRIRITAQLTEPESDQLLWAEGYERDMRDVLLLQSEVARAIAEEVQVALTPEDTTRLARARPVNPEAHDAYLQGRFHANKMTPHELDTALSYFELAVAKDPNYALGYVGIQSVWGRRRQQGYVRPSEALPTEKAAMLKALDLDDSHPEMYHRLAGLKTWGEWDWPAAEQAFERALELDPNYADARNGYSLFLSSMGRPDEALAQSEQALELDPLNALYQAFYGKNLVYVRRYDDAIARLRDALRATPGLPFAANSLVNALHLKGAREEALHAQRSFLAAIDDQESEEAVRQGYAEGGYEGAMRRLADTAAARSLETHTSAFWVAGHYIRAGENELALEWLETAYTDHDPQMTYLGWPIFDDVRDDPRFQDLLRRMNLPQ